tara:strand:+ start:454 stop:1209 length:756 start_codon:yes stop_codon:yes gene_type:complete
MPRYSDDQIDEFETNKRDWLARGSKLTTSFLTHRFKNERAERFSREGFARRLGYLEHIFERIEEIYPPNCTNADRRVVRDAEVLLQSFTMNVFGALDNLAWVWALENDLRNAKGSPLGPSEMVFSGRRSKALRKSLSKELKNSVDESADWFDIIGLYRHGVAHQIPLYIPRNLNPKEVRKVEEYRAEINNCIKRGDWRRVSELNSRIYALGDFGPYMALCEPHPPMLLHPQMVCDYATVVNLGELILKALK